MLPAAIAPQLQDHLKRIEVQHQDDLRRGHGEVYLPYALDKKYPNAATEWKWQYVFPAANISRDSRSGGVNRGGRGVKSPLDQ